MKQASDRLEAMEAAMALSMGPGWKRRVSAIAWRGEGGEGVVVVEWWSGAEERRGVTARCRAIPAKRKLGSVRHHPDIKNPRDEGKPPPPHRNPL